MEQPGGASEMRACHPATCGSGIRPACKYCDDGIIAELLQVAAMG